MNQSIRRIPILIAMAALAAAIFVPQASAAIGPPTFSFAFGSSGSGNGQFNAPEDGIAFDKEGNAWISDTSNSRIQKFNAKGEYLSQFGSHGAGNGQFYHPRDIDIDAAGNLWVADAQNGRIQKFNSKGEYLSQFGTKGSGNGQLNYPSGIAIDAQGNIWVTESLNKRVQKFNSKGEYLSQFGSYGTGNGQFGFLGDIDIDAAGNLLVADAGNHRVQKFNSKGEYLSQFGTKGTGNGQFQGPRGIVLGAGGTIWVADRGNRRVQAFSSAGEYLTQFGEEGSGNGQFKGSPAGVAFDPNGDLWVSDTDNHRIQVFTRQWRIGGKTLAELGASKALAVFGDSLKIEIPSKAATINCSQAGAATISGTGGLETTIELGCKLVGFEAQCTFEPVTLSFSGTAGKVTPKTETMFLKTPGKTCSFFFLEGQPVALPSFTVEVGSEGVKVPVNFYATGFFGGHAMNYSSSPSWVLSGEYLDKTLGLW